MIAAWQSPNGGTGHVISRLAMKVVCFTLAAWVAVSGGYSQGPAAQDLVVWIALDGHAQLKKAVPGTTLEGKLTRSVYWHDTEIFPKGSVVRLVIDKVESRKKAYAVDDRPFVVHVFAPRHELVAGFRSVDVSMPEGALVPLRATFIGLSQRAELRARAAKPTDRVGKSPGGDDGHTPKLQKAVPPWTLTLQVEPESTTFSALAATRAGSPSSGPRSCPEECNVASDTQMPLVLLHGLSASRNHQGESFQAVLLEPILLGTTIVIPQGSIFQGVLAKRVPPRRLYRPGSLNLLFTNITLPNGTATAIAASPVAAEVDRGTHMTIDSEGGIHAQNPGKARFLLDFGVTGGISKVSDDTTQLIIEAISSTATDASTAGVARLAAMAVTGIFLLTRHGRDVILPPYTEMDVSLSRAVSLGNTSPSTKSLK